MLTNPRALQSRHRISQVHLVARILLVVREGVRRFWLGNLVGSSKCSVHMPFLINSAA
jgi:hypothetical protein